MNKSMHWKTEAFEPAKPPCTLLIPARLQPYLRKRYRKQGPLIAYMAFLLGKSAAYRAGGRLPEVDRVTRKYQAEKQSLQRWHVRVPGELWTELRCLAGACGLTMTHMFVILVLLDEEDQKVRTHDGAPTFLGKKVAFFQGVDLTKGITVRKVRFVATDRPAERFLRLIGPGNLVRQLRKIRALMDGQKLS
ncbi:MAG: DUF1564 family protein [Leptospiraceae bacterium]|nr:DUF1564 family protein [Leptospiraceae bacterium]